MRCQYIQTPQLMIEFVAVAMLPAPKCRLGPIFPLRAVCLASPQSEKCKYVSVRPVPLATVTRVMLHPTGEGSTVWLVIGCRQCISTQTTSHSEPVVPQCPSHLASLVNEGLSVPNRAPPSCSGSAVRRLGTYESCAYSNCE